jgi:hypothetical protein
LVAIAVLVLLKLVASTRKPMAALAHEPLWKLKRPHANGKRCIPHIALGWFAKVVALGEIKVGIERTEARQK